MAEQPPVQNRGKNGINSSASEIEGIPFPREGYTLNQKPLGDYPISHDSESVLDDLYKTKQVVELVKYSIISAQIKNSPIAPLSPWLIAPIEHNKTRILLKFLKAPNVVKLENLSAKPLNKLIREQDKKQTVYHIILFDLERQLSSKYTVVKPVFGTLLNLLDEGCQASLYYGQVYQLKHRIKMGVITALTPEVFKQHFGAWNKTGHLTRILPISYRYSESTKQGIDRYIRQDVSKIVDNITACIRLRGKQDVFISNNDIACAIQNIRDKVLERLKQFHVTRQTKYGTYKVYFNIEGLRLHHMLRLLAKSIAYEKGRNEVNYEDLMKLKELSDFIRLPDNPKEV